MSDPSVNTPLSPTEVLHRYAQGQRNFQALELSDANWAGLNLKGADFSYADLSRANLSGTNLRGADLSYARLNEANLSGADLRGTTLIGTDLRNANVDQANFLEADYDPQTTHFPSGFIPQVH